MYRFVVTNRYLSYDSLLMSPDAFPPSDASGDSSNEVPFIPQSLEEVDSEMQTLLRRLEELREVKQRMAGGGRQPVRTPDGLGLGDIDTPWRDGDDQYESVLLPNFADLVRRGNEESQFYDILVPLARHVERELLLLVDSMLVRRMFELEKSMHLSPGALAAQAGYESEGQMHQGIVLEVAREALTEYLTDNRDAMSIGHIADLGKRIDQALNVPPGVPPATETDPRREMLRFSTRVIFRMAREIIRNEALKRGEFDPLSQHDVERACAEYAWLQTGRSYDDLLSDMTERLIRESYMRSEEYLDAMGIRHTALGILQEYVIEQDLSRHGEAFVLKPSARDTQLDAVLSEELGNILNDCRRETTLIQFGARGQKVHLPLPPKERDFVRSTSVRLMGYDADGNRMPSLEPDFATFRMLEQELLKWQEPLRGHPHTGYLNEEQRKAIQRFYEQGGHSSAFTDDQIEYIRTHGLILFIERQTREGLRVPLGSISVLSRTPSSGESVDLDPRAWQHSEEVLRLFPQYDFEDLLPEKTPDDFRHSLRSTVASRILICRSSILSSVGSDALGESAGSTATMSLRRLGLASRLKYEALNIASLFGSSSLTFNIGTILASSDGELRMVNKPSTEHNSWADVLAWRNYFSKVIDGVVMRWTAYQGKIADGLEEISRPNGLMAGKDWDMDAAKSSVILNARLLQEDIIRNDHAPW